METRLLRAISRLHLGRLSSGTASYDSSLASRICALDLLSKRFTGTVVAFNNLIRSPLKSLLIGFCLVLSPITGCLETLDEVIDRNEPPKANAGEDFNAELEGQEVTVNLDGSKSEDKDGKIVKYRWKGGQVEPLVSMDGGSGDGGAASGNADDTIDADDAGDSDGGAVETESAAEESEANPEERPELMETPDPDDVKSPRVSLGEGKHTFHLWVTDDDGAISVDSVVVTVVKP